MADEVSIVVDVTEANVFIQVEEIENVTLVVDEGTLVLKRWNGSAWVDATLRIYNGSQFIKSPLKMWDGDKWKNVQIN